MRDEHRVERFQADARIDDPARHAEPAIDNDRLAADLEQRRGRRGPTRPDRRPVFGAEEDEAVGHRRRYQSITTLPELPLFIASKPSRCSRRCRCGG